MANQPQENQIRVPNTSDKCVQDAQFITLGNMAFDGTGTIIYTFQQAGVSFKNPTGIRALYFDARSLSGDALIAFTNGPTLRLPNGKQGYIPIFLPAPVNLSISSAVGVGPLSVYLANFKIYPMIW